MLDDQKRNPSDVRTVAEGKKLSGMAAIKAASEHAEKVEPISADTLPNQRKPARAQSNGPGAVSHSVHSKCDEERADPPEQMAVRRPRVEVTEDGIAQELVRRHDGRIKFDHSRNVWFIWDKCVWQKDVTGRIRQILREITREATKRWSHDEARKVRRATFISGAERMAKTDRRVSVTADHWDSDKMLLGCPGATVNLTTGEIRKPDPSNAITKLCGVAPGKGSCPTWLQFLQDVTDGDEDVIAFIQLWVGYLLTGRTDEQVLLFIHGPGGNGKSVFLNVISRILGEYSATAAMDTFTKSRNDRHPTDLAMLCGARSVSVSETEDGRNWAEARVKQLTGGDEITARFMRQDYFSFLPSFKLTIVGNHQPMLSNVDPAMKRRFLVLPFEHHPKTKDPDLEMKLWAEAPQILEWAIRGCLEWQQRDLPRPATIMDATEHYFEEQDTFSQWMEERCELVPSGGFTSAADLYHSWRRHAEDLGEEPSTSKTLGQKSKRNGLSSRQKRILGRNCKVWFGISMRTPELK